MVSNKRLVDWARRYNQRLESLTDEASSILTEGITNSWSNLVDDVARAYRRIESDGEGRYTLSDATRRLEQVNSVIRDWLPTKSPVLKSLTKDFAKRLQQSEKLGLQFADQVKKLVYPDSELSDLGRVRFDAVVEAATGIASRMWRYNEDLRIRSGQAVVNSLVRGQSAAGLARQLREFVQQPIAGINRIARTELASAYVKATQKSYEEDGVEYGQWAAVESLRTCPYCAARHMKVYRLQDLVIPAHPNCLCSILPVSPERLEDEDFWQESYEEQQAILQELEAAGRKPDNRPTPFEKFAGIAPPQPVWEPFNPETQAPPKTAIAEAETAVENDAGWPPVPTTGTLKDGKGKPVEILGRNAYDFSDGDIESDEQIFGAPPEEREPSEAAIEALGLFTENYDDFKATERALRQGKRLDEEQQALVNSLDEAVNSARLPVDTVLYRGLKGKFAQDLIAQAEAGELIEGTVLADKSFVSTSLSQERAEAFATNKGVVLRVVAPAGATGLYSTSVMPWSGAADDREVVLARNSQFKVVGLSRDAKGRLVIDCDLASDNPRPPEPSSGAAPKPVKIPEPPKVEAAPPPDPSDDTLVPPPVKTSKSVASQFVSSSRSAVTGEKIDEYFDALESLGGEARQNIRNLRDFIVRNQAAILFGTPSKVSLNTFVQSPAVEAALERGVAIAQAENGKNGEWLNDRFKQAVRAYRDSGGKDAQASSTVAKLAIEDDADGEHLLGTAFIKVRSQGQQAKPLDTSSLANTIKQGLTAKQAPEIMGDFKATTPEALISTIIHEFGHMVHTRGSDGRSRRVGRMQQWPEDFAERAVSAYGREDYMERFAEAFVAFMISPQALKKSRPQTYDFVKQIFDRARANI